MANQEHLNRLRGWFNTMKVNSWNKWRRWNPTIEPDLRGVNFSSANLHVVDLNIADLQKADLSNANLIEADFRGANLVSVNLCNANLMEADLSGANLDSAYLCRTYLDKAKLTGANLRQADLREANFRMAYLNEANLSITDFRQANLFGANLRKADLYGADLREADLREANLIGADLRKANLTRTQINQNTTFDDKWLLVWKIINQKTTDLNFRKTDLSEINFSKINLSGANLSDANLSDTNLSGANLSGANLSEVNFNRTQALSTNFRGAIFTGACIKDWNINNETNLDNIICDYIYLKQNQQERRPSDPNKKFKPGDFTNLVQKSLNTIDLIFSDGIDWSTFFTSFQNLQVESDNCELAIQAIERKAGGAFVIRLEVSLDTNKAQVEASFWSKYKHLLEAKDREIELLSQTKDCYFQQIQDIRKDNTRLIEIVETMAEKEISQVNMTFNGPVSNVVGNIEGDQIIYDSEQKQTLAEAAEEIQKLLKQLEQTNPTATEEEKIAHVNEETSSDFKKRTASALKAASDTAIEEFLNRPLIKVVASGVKAWMLPD